MAIVKIELPEITTVSFRQEKSDKDYGSCMWARFNFDTKNYSLSIESDCGNYCYGWYPTPNSETFFHLCARFDSLYLLGKISSMSEIDEETTLQELKEYLKHTDEEAYEKLTATDLRLLEDACYSYNDEYAVVTEIQSVLNGTEFYGVLTDYDVACCIVKDYPNDAKKIVAVFRDHIQPVVGKLSETKQGGLTIPELKPCKCGGEVQVEYACGEYFIVCENGCMDIPPCFHSSEKATVEEWNKSVNNG